MYLTVPSGKYDSELGLVVRSSRALLDVVTSTKPFSVVWVHALHDIFAAWEAVTADQTPKFDNSRPTNGHYASLSR